MAHIYLQLGDRAIRACVVRNAKDQHFHCTCGHDFSTKEDILRHGRENKDLGHPTNFYELFTSRWPGPGSARCSKRGKQLLVAIMWLPGSSPALPPINILREDNRPWETASNSHHTAPWFLPSASSHQYSLGALGNGFPRPQGCRVPIAGYPP